MVNSDLRVEAISNALQDKHLDVVVSGSIGAVESTRFIRSLRRLGARVTPWLTEGAQQFTTETALSWAAAEPTVRKFSGEASHIALGDACIVAPASASIIAKIASGITDSPSSALVASYLGQNKKVLFLPNMHESLRNSPIIDKNIEQLRELCVEIPAREEEGKLKFPDPASLADIVAHELNKDSVQHRCLVSMGTTRGYIDSVRYISNYSSGSLGSKISEELYRQGIECNVVAGPCEIKPKSYSKLIPIKTNDELEKASLEEIKQQPCSVVFASSVLDYVPNATFDGKLKSNEDLKVEFEKCDKIIAKLKVESGRKVGFKLEADLDIPKAEAIAADYIKKYQLSMIVINSLKDVDDRKHTAFVFTEENGKLQHIKLQSKQAIATEIVNHIKKDLS